jgi:hypothetical protein
VTKETTTEARACLIFFYFLRNILFLSSVREGYGKTEKRSRARVWIKTFFFSIWLTVDVTIFCFRVLWLRIMISAATVVVVGLGRGGVCCVYYCVSNLYDPLGTGVGFWWTDLRWTDVEGRKEGVAGGKSGGRLVWREGKGRNGRSLDREKSNGLA